VELTTVGRGQELVLDCADWPDAIPWAVEIIARNTPGAQSFARST